MPKFGQFLPLQVRGWAKYLIWRMQRGAVEPHQKLRYINIRCLGIAITKRGIEEAMKFASQAPSSRNRASRNLLEHNILSFMLIEGGLKVD